MGIGGSVASDVLAVDFDWVIGAGVGERVGSAGVPITFKIGSVSDSPVCGPEPGEEDELDWKVGSMRVVSGPELADFASRSPQSRGRFRFTVVDGPGVPGFGPDVTGCGLLALRLELLYGDLTVVEAIVSALAGDGSRVWSGVVVRIRSSKPHSRTVV